MKDNKKKLSRSTREKVTRLLIGTCICLTMAFLPIWNLPLLEQAHREIYDIFLHWNRGGTPSPTPAIVDIDEASLKEFGQWPWPRHLMGKLVQKLTEQGAAAIGLDIILAEPDNTSVINVQKSFKTHFNIHLPIDDIPKSYHDNDQIFAIYLQQCPVILGSYVQFEGTPIPVKADIPYNESIVDVHPPNTPNLRKKLLTGSSATFPLPELYKYAPLGMINATPDDDGVLRSLPLVATVGDRTLIALSVRSLMRALNEKQLTLEGGKDGVHTLHVGKYAIPVNAQGIFTVPFRGGTGTYPYFRAADILTGKIPAEEIAGRVFFVGSSAPGLMDLRANPFSAVYPGVESHAASLDAILSQKFIQAPANILGWQITSIVILGSICTLIFTFTPPIVYLPLLISFLSVTLFGSWQLFTHGIFASPVYIMLTVTSLALTLLAVRFWQESKQRRTLRNAFSRYIAPDMVERIVEMGDVVLTGEKRTITLMFTDIRGFTAISEKLNPEQVVEALNAYFTPMTAIIRAHQGTMDKFIGDAIMAFWNAPLTVPNHQLQAIQSAMEMQETLVAMRRTFQENFGIIIRIGIGVHTGDGYVGNMGSEELLDYTCIGDTVNLTSRLEGLCPVYGVGIITSQETAQQCIATESISPPYFLPLDSIQVKGKNEPVDIVTPISFDEKERRSAEFEAFAKARTLYTEGKFEQAHVAFTTLHKQYPDILFYNLYTTRCEHMKNSPPEHWKGVWQYTKK